MSRRNQGRNERMYVVRYLYNITAARTTWDFRTQDKRQAFRKARRYAEGGLLVGLFQHRGGGRWEELPVPGVAKDGGDA